MLSVTDGMKIKEEDDKPGIWSPLSIVNKKPGTQSYNYKKLELANSLNE